MKHDLYELGRYIKLLEPESKRKRQRDTKGNGFARAIHRAAKLKEERDANP